MDRASDTDAGVLGSNPAAGKLLKIILNSGINQPLLPPIMIIAVISSLLSSIFIDKKLHYRKKNICLKEEMAGFEHTTILLAIVLVYIKELWTSLKKYDIFFVYKYGERAIC